MFSRAVRVWFLVAAVVTAHAQSTARPESHYVIRAIGCSANADGRIPLDVTWTILAPPAGSMVIACPRWTPGSYRLRDFPERIDELSARIDGEQVRVERLRLDAWLVPTGDTDRVEIRYRVWLKETDRFMLPGNKRRALTYEGPQVYLYIRQLTNIPCHVKFVLPAGYSVASGLRRAEDGGYFAANYDQLADCPVKLGEFQTFDFEAAGARIEVVVDGPGEIEFEYPIEDWLGRIREIVETQAEIFGGLPFPRYVFLFTAVPGAAGGGGLEHLNSTCIGVSARALRRNPGTGIGTAAHEFFHLWNVKRIRPAALGPFDYSRPVRTRGLWLAEGVTSYYAQVTLHRMRIRAGESPDRVLPAFAERMRRAIQTLEANPARFHVGSTDSSEQMWEQKPADRFINYYGSGLVLGFLLDAEIRTASDNRRSLDDFMRTLLAFCEGQGRGYHDDELPMLLATVAGHESSWRDWLDRHVDGTVPPDYPRILGAIGLQAAVQRNAPTRYVRGARVLRVRGATPKVYWSQPDRLDRRWPSNDHSRHGFVERAAGQDVDSIQAWRTLVANSNEDRMRLRIRGVDGRTRDTVADVGVRYPTEVELRVDPDATPNARQRLLGIVTGNPPRPGR